MKKLPSIVETYLGDLRRIRVSGGATGERSGYGPLANLSVLDEPTPVEADPTGEWYCFQKGATKDSGRKGWADVWKRRHFGWEYKGNHKNLNRAFRQLRQYALGLENPPLLIVSDMRIFRIHTNWTNSVSKVHEFGLGELVDQATFNKLKWAFSDPERLRPEQTREALTQQAASTFASLAQRLREGDCEPEAVARFVNRLVFCMFAEDMRLLPDRLFERMLEQADRRPEQFQELASDLFAKMASGGMVGYEEVAWFNGGLFDDGSALPLDRPGINMVREVARLDWSDIDPSIMGTLFEQGLDPNKQPATESSERSPDEDSRIGVHYTDPEKIMLIVEPVIERPWLVEWARTKERIETEVKRAKAVELLDRVDLRAEKSRRRQRAERLLSEFLARLRQFKVLDPACGSGNFLYIALRTLKDLEHRANLEAQAMGLGRRPPTIGPANVKGIELNAYAAELARTSIWIGEIQWMRRNGFEENRNPILSPLDTIECRDAVLTADGKEPEWPAADVVIGNPPFLGGKLLRGVLGGDYLEGLQRLYGERIHGDADLVCHWFDKAERLVSEDKVARAGLVGTNSIRGGRNRSVLDGIVERDAIYDAWSDEPWVVDGAAVRVSLVCFSGKNAGLPTQLNGEDAPRINADLTSASVDLTQAVRLPQNAGVAFMGDTKGGPFDIPGDQAREWLQLPSNPNGRPNSEVLRPWVNGMDLTRRPRGKWIVDYGWTMSENEAALYEAPYQWVKERVHPMRQRNRREAYRRNWWRHVEPRPGMWRGLDGLSRYIATPMVAKHRLFVWCDARICPDHQLIVVARDDDTTFGILHSRFHELWSLRLGTSLEDRPRYTPTTTFQTFPFPEGLTPDTPAVEYAHDARAIAIADAARRLVELRDRWLNPPEWVEWVDEPVAGYPKRPVLTATAPPKELGRRTLTNLYNKRPQWLEDAHEELDAAVARAYRWPPSICQTDALSQLLRLNFERS